MNVYLVYGYDCDGCRILLNVADSKKTAESLANGHKYEYRDCFVQVWKVETSKG